MDGEKGDKGDKGDQGDIGFTGPKGDTGAQGVQGIQGPAGVKGDKGDTGNTGATGADGEAATIRIGNVTSGISPSIINSGTAQDAVFDFILPKGDKGDPGEKGEDGTDGKSFDIKAQYPNEAALRAAHPTGEAGDAYFVGTDENPDLYVWLTDDNDWFNNGKLAGVKGDKGDKGEKGFSPIAQVTKVGKVATISIRDEVGTTTATVSDGEEGSNGKSAYEVAVDEGFVGTEAEWLASLVGPQGAQGVQGPQGIQGVQGIQGETGIGVPDSGAQGQVLTKKSGINYDTEWKTLGTAAEKNATSFVRPNSHDLVDSNAVYQAINNALSSIYTPHGEIACEDLVPALLIAENVGNIYETSDSGVTTEYFINGSGKAIAQGDSVGIVQAGPNMYLFNLMAGKIDLSEYQKKELETAIGSATTVEDALGALSDNKQAKILTTSVESATTVEGALGALSTNKATQAEVNGIVNVLGAKNVFPITRPSRTTNTGVTFTVNSDGSVTANGTASADTWFQLCDGFKLKDVGYTLTGCPSGGSSTTYELQFRSIESSSSQWQMVNDYGNGKTATGDSTRTYIGFVGIHSGYTATNLTFYPMIRLTSDLDDTYVPYAMTNQQMTPYVQAISNPNLLDNPWFTVNQRALTTYTTPTSGRKYTADRWSINTHLSATVDSNGITLTSDDSGVNGDLEHKFENSMYPFLINRLATLSAKLSDGTIYSISGVINPSQVGTIRLDLKDGWKIDVNTGSSGTVGVYIFSGTNNPNSSITVRAVKLELGGVSTLAMDCPPNYVTELLKCQRYFERNNWYDWCCVNCTTAGQLNLGMSYPFLVKKRTSPTFAFNVPGNTGIGNGYVIDLTDGTHISASEVVLQQPSAWNYRMIQMKITHSSFIVGHTYAVAVGDNTVDISADL